MNLRVKNELSFIEKKKWKLLLKIVLIPSQLLPSIGFIVEKEHLYPTKFLKLISVRFFLYIFQKYCSPFFKEVLWPLLAVHVYVLSVWNFHVTNVSNEST